MPIGVWRPLRRPDLGLANSLSELICVEEFRRGEPLTSLRRGSTLLLVGDYGGRHRAATHETISLLLLDLEYLWLWDELRREVRSNARLNSRRISYKALNDVRRRRALVPFLTAANTIPGLLATFAIDKKLSLRVSEGIPILEKNPVGDLSDWKPKAFKKLTLVGLLGAMLIAGMSMPGQNVIWISDEDELAPNKLKIRDATKVLGCYVSQISPHAFGHFRFGTTESTTRMMLFEDAAAIPDLTAGALASFTEKWVAHYGCGPGRLMLESPNAIPPKDRVISAWLAEDHYALRKISFIVDAKEEGYVTKAICLRTDAQVLDFDCRPAMRRHLAGKILY